MTSHAPSYRCALVSSTWQCRVGVKQIENPALALFAVDQAAFWQAHGRQRVGTSAASDSACVTVAETCTTATRRRRERPGTVKMSSQPMCVFTRPVCMAGVGVSRPNRSALCGRMKL